MKKYLVGMKILGKLCIYEVHGDFVDGALRGRFRVLRGSDGETEKGHGFWPIGRFDEIEFIQLLP